MSAQSHAAMVSSCQEKDVILDQTLGAPRHVMVQHLDGHVSMTQVFKDHNVILYVEMGSKYFKTKTVTMGTY